MKINKDNLVTIIAILIFFIPFVWGTNLWAIWFSDMGRESLSITKQILISFIVLSPYWVVFIIGIFKNFKKTLINYNLFNIIFFIIYCYYFILINTTINNLIYK